MNDATTIDVGSWLLTLARNWWVILGLAVLGAVVGGVVSLSSPKVYTASASVYIGQTTDANGNTMVGLTSNSRAATDLLASQVVLAQAAKQTGMGATASLLRRETTVETPSSTIKTTTSVVNIIVINVTDTKKARATAAANALAAGLIQRIGPAVAAKIALLQQQLNGYTTALAASQARSAAAQKALTAIAQSGGAAASKSLASAQYVAVAQAAATEQDTLSTAQQRTSLLLLVAKNVEQPSILHEAVLPDAPSGPDSKLNLAVGAVAGVVVGIVAAFVRRRLSERG